MAPGCPQPGPLGAGILILMPRFHITLTAANYEKYFCMMSSHGFLHQRQNKGERECLVRGRARRIIKI